MSPLGRQPDGVWLAKAARVLHGAETFAASDWIAEGMTPDALHDTLLSIAQRGNSTRPIAARVQSNPARVARLLGADNLTAHQARDGCAYNLVQRPYQFRRPRPIRLAADGLRAASDEIDRL